MFFQNEAIQALWWSPEACDGNEKKQGYINSEKLEHVLSSIDSQVKEKLISLLEKVAPAGKTVI